MATAVRKLVEVKTVESSYELILTRSEALVVKALVGNVIGQNKFTDAASCVWYALEDTDLTGVEEGDTDWPNTSSFTLLTPSSP